MAFTATMQRDATPATLATPLPRTLTLAPGTMLAGRFQLAEMLGRGGMGAVYKAKDLTLDEVVAIKLMRPEFAENQKMADRFKQEIKLARKVRHRNVCAIHDYGEVDGLLYISMELVDGIDLKQQLLRQGPPPPAQAYDVALQVAEGLHAVHQAGIVHRDLKPSNVVIGADGVARIMDFGIAKRQQSSGQGITATGDIVGTPEYMSPEQAKGRALDARSDVYALGVLVYEVFTGRLPFRGDTPISTILKHLQEPPPLEGPAAQGITPELKPVLKKALAKEPAQRYADAGEMAHALRLAREKPVEAPGSRRLPLLPLAGAAAVALVAAAGWLALRDRPVPEPAAQVPPPAAAAPPATAPPTLAPATTLAAVVPPPVTAPAAEAVPKPTPRPARVEGTPAPRLAAVVATPPPAPAPAVVAPARPGQLAVVVKPWAEVSVDGRSLGETPFPAVSLPAGDHVVRIRHPGWEPLDRRVTIASGETLRLVVDLNAEGRKR